MDSLQKGNRLGQGPFGYRVAAGLYAALESQAHLLVTRTEGLFIGEPGDQIGIAGLAWDAPDVADQ